MKKYFIILIVFTVLISCDGGPKINGAKAPENTDAVKKQLAINNGRIYYETNCSGCHAAGNADPTSAFNASDLKLSTKITTDMSGTIIYGGQYDLMKRFTAVPRNRIDDLKTYLTSVGKL
jgi:mono/diheme cytochrome c family protein